MGNTDIEKAAAALRATYNSDVTRPISWRLKQLRTLEKMLVTETDTIRKAMFEDLHQSPFLTDLAEVSLPLKEVRLAIASLADWMRPEPGTVPAALLPGSCERRREPFGTVLIISPFNYPISLALKPLVGALAAGNTVMLKPSEVAPACSAALAAMIAKYFDPACVACVLGGIPETTALLELRWDKIM
jgi:aldehyde dehydrogenase (NAD+)